MNPSKTLDITHRDGRLEKIQVIEVGLRTFLDYCAPSSYGAALAEAAVRLNTASGLYERRAPEGWLDTLTDESAAAVIAASNQLNFSLDRAKKAAALIHGWRSRISEEPPSAPPISTPSGAPSNS
jgi:hypothetical protein